MTGPEPGVLKYGIGYDLVCVAQRAHLHLGIRCHRCGRISFHPRDITERYCGACHVFHEPEVPGE